MRILRASDYRRVPWRNGGGETLEILVHPAGAGMDFEWRVSMAPVTEAGPFSRFPGVDRVLTVIEGKGLGLALDGRAPVVVGDDPFAFSGDIACAAVLGAGPIVDLNVMTRRGRWRPEVRWTDRPAELPSGGTQVVFAADGPLSGRVGGMPFDLGDHDALQLEGAECAGLDLAGRWLDIRLVPHIEGFPT
jgi:environmental stress-induced protein Ves